MPVSKSSGHAAVRHRVAYCLLPMLLGISAALLLLFVASGPARQAFAGNLTFPGACGATIQACIDGASPGDTILISAGNYTESLTLSKAVSLTGALSSTTILHALPNTRVLTVTGAAVNSSVVISGLTFTGGHIGSSPFCTGECNGGGVLVTGTAQPRLSNLRLMSNTATYGAGLYANGDLTVSDSSFVDNVIGGMVAGGGLYVQGVAQVINCTFINNYASSGGGLYAHTATVTGSSFVGNQNSGIYAGANVTVTDSSFIDNVGNNGAGLFANSAASVSGSQFVGNNGSNGAGLYAYVSAVSSSSFMSNSAYGAGGGGGLFSIYSALVSGSQFFGNYGNYGGGLSAGSATVTNSSFISNYANTGAGLYASVSAVVSSSTFMSNSAFGAGGGLNAGSATVTDSSFNANSANNGAGLYSNYNVAVSSSRFISNLAQTGGGGVQLSGGSSGSRVVNSLFTRNRSALGGAAVDVQGASLLLLDNTIADPALAPGAAVVVAGGSVGITNTILANQTVAISVTSGSVFQDYNLFFANGTDKTGTVSGGGHNAAGDPAFRDPAHDDYHITVSSAARNRGINVGVTTDFEGDPRPFGGGFDIGFDQYALRLLFLALVRR